MRAPIAYALAWPQRLTSGVEFLDLIRTARLEFCAPDGERFRGLGLAQAAARAGGLQPAILNAANEVAVEAFLERRLNFLEIPAVIEAVVKSMNGGAISSLEEVLAADAEARCRAQEQLRAHA
jgi:1-deoxy-D-xylulose-5-phosphate reductoisomerase